MFVELVLAVLFHLAVPTPQCGTDKRLLEVVLLKCSAAKLVELIKQKRNAEV